MKKFKHREVLPKMAVWYLFGGAGLLGGCHTPSGYKPALPESCSWLKFPILGYVSILKKDDMYPKRKLRRGDPTR